MKSGIACFQIPENPELLDDLKFQNGTSSGSGNLSQKRRTDCKRRLSNRPEHGKSKISRETILSFATCRKSGHGKITVLINPFQMRLPTEGMVRQNSQTAELLRDFIEFKLHFGMEVKFAPIKRVRLPHSSRAHKITADFARFHSASCVSSPSAVELPQMSGGTCREQSLTDASDSSMCGSNCASRPERASSSSRKISRGKGNFPLASIPAADIPRSHSFYSPVMSDDSGRNSREETTGSAGDKKSTPPANQEQQVAGRKGKYRNQKPSPTLIPATIDRDLDPSKRPPTGGWVMRISDCPHPIEQGAFRENACFEWMTCLSCGARWSRKTGQDDIQVKMGLTVDQPQLTPPCPGCASTTRLQQMANKTETFFGWSRFPLCKRVVHTSHTMESRVSPSAHSCSAAQPMAEQVMVLDSDSVGSEESFTMLNVPAESAVTQQEQQFLLKQLRHLSSSGITGQEARRAIVRMFPDKQQKVKVSKAVRTLQDTMQKI